MASAEEVNAAWVNQTRQAEKLLVETRTIIEESIEQLRAWKPRRFRANPLKKLPRAIIKIDELLELGVVQDYHKQAQLLYAFAGNLVHFIEHAKLSENSQVHLISALSDRLGEFTDVGAALRDNLLSLRRTLQDFANSKAA